MSKDYSPAESVEEIARKILPKDHSELATARIAYVFVAEGSKKAGKPVLGKVRKLSGAIEFLLEKDFLIEVALDYWNELNDNQRLALVDHLLERCTGEEDEESGEMKWATREPDVHEFTSILTRHGAWTSELDDLVSVAQKINIDERIEEVSDSKMVDDVTA